MGLSDAKKNGITDGVVTLGRPSHVDMTGDRAYVVIPSNYTFKQTGAPMREVGSARAVIDRILTHLYTRRAGGKLQAHIVSVVE